MRIQDHLHSPGFLQLLFPTFSHLVWHMLLLSSRTLLGSFWHILLQSIVWCWLNISHCFLQPTQPQVTHEVHICISKNMSCFHSQGHSCMQYVDKLVRITVPKVPEASFSKYELYSVKSVFQFFAWLLHGEFILICALQPHLIIWKSSNLLWTSLAMDNNQFTIECDGSMNQSYAG
jgi:hypothetical protein